jgi:hypothetical protein
VTEAARARELSLFNAPIAVELDKFDAFAKACLDKWSPLDHVVAVVELGKLW